MKIMTEHIPEQTIPAHDSVTKIYTFDELDDNIKDRKICEYGDFHSEAWDGDYRATLKALEELFGVTCQDWEVNPYRHNYTLYAFYGQYTRTHLDEAAEVDGEEYGYLALRGLRAMGKCWTRWGREVTKGKYFKKGRAPKHSRVLFDGLHDGSCPLTGYCADNDALDPLWNMMEGKDAGSNTTIAEMIDACFDAFFTAWEKDIAYGYSEEGFRESPDFSEWYDEDGEPVEVPEGATLTDPDDAAAA